MGTKFVLIFAVEILCLTLLLKLAAFMDPRYLLASLKIRCVLPHTQEGRNVPLSKCLKIDFDFVQRPYWIQENISLYMYRQTKAINFQEIAWMFVENDGEDWHGQMKERYYFSCFVVSVLFHKLKCYFRKFPETSVEW